MAGRSSTERDAARDTLLRLLHQRLEDACERAAGATAFDQMAVVGGLCIEAERLAAVIDLLGPCPWDGLKA